METKYVVEIHKKDLIKEVAATSFEEAGKSFLNSFFEKIDLDDRMEIKEKKVFGAERTVDQVRDFLNYLIEFDDVSGLLKDWVAAVHEEGKRGNDQGGEKPKDSSNQQEDRKKFLEKLEQLGKLVESESEALWNHIDFYIENAFQLIDSSFSGVVIEEKELVIRKKIFSKSSKIDAVREAIKVYQSERNRRTFLSVMKQFEGISDQVGALEAEIGKGNNTRITTALAGSLFATEGIKAIREDEEGGEIEL